MKKLIIIFISLILSLFIGLSLIISIDKNSINNLKEDITKNVGIKDITYINKYDNNYIVTNNEYLYLFNSQYVEIYKVDVSLLHDNTNNYDLIYRDNQIMYIDSYQDKDKLIFKYYDIYTYELIEEITL